MKQFGGEFTRANRVGLARAPKNSSNMMPYDFYIEFKNRFYLKRTMSLSSYLTAVNFLLNERGLSLDDADIKEFRDLEATEITPSVKGGYRRKSRKNRKSRHRKTRNRRHQ